MYLFIDLFMCTLFMFFMEYEPVNCFRGNKLKRFRAMAAIPILYEVGALILRITIIMTDLKPSYIVYPFLTTKPFMSFILFIILALHIKLDEKRFMKRDKSTEDFEAYTNTNDHSLRFSIFTSVMILITGLIDLVVYIGGTAILSIIASGVNMDAELTQEGEKAIEKVLPLAEKVVSAWRFGEHYGMILLIPIILLFSYTRTYENQKKDIFIPIGGVALAVLVGIEGLYQGLVMNLPIVIQNITNMAAQFFK